MAHGHRCTACGGACKGGFDHSSLHLHVEIENLKQKLLERESHIVTMETNFLTEVDKFPNGECAAMAEELLTWQEKYSRLYEAHKRIQRVNQNLEDKLLKIVDKCETAKFCMTREMSTLKQQLLDAEKNSKKLTEENERNRNDVNLAIQLLQCKPSNFVSQKFESLPVDLQQKVKVYMTSKKKSCDGTSAVKHEVKTIKVPIPTFPPTAMFYSVNKSVGGEEDDEEKGKPVDIVSAAIVAKILEEREKERQNLKHCGSCICPSRRGARDAMVQTEDSVRLNLGEGEIIRVESYQSSSPAVSSVRLIEHSPLAVGSSPCGPPSRNPMSVSNASTPPTHGNRRPDVTKLNVGRNRYHSSKLNRGANRRRERVETEPMTARHSEIHLDDSGEVSCDIATLNLRSEKDEVEAESQPALRRVSEVAPDSRPGARRCSVSIHPGSSNILLDNATCYVPTLARTANPYAFLHSSRSSSTSSMEERPTETQI